MGLISGLKKFGLGELEKLELFDNEEEKKAKQAQKEMVKEEAHEITEADLLFDKSYTCPVCDAEFKVKTVRSGKAKMSGSDSDLRPRYEKLDVLKYDTVVCPVCGYAALNRYFEHIGTGQARLIRDQISIKYKPQSYEGDIYTYEDAFERYQLVLASTAVKRARVSEKAYICLKLGWLLRGMLENLEMDATYIRKKITYTRKEEEYMREAYNGFLTARSTEPFPICGMDEETVDYLLAALSLRFKEFDLCGRLISQLLSSKTAKKRTKDRARLLKDELAEAVLKEKQEKAKENNKKAET